jgi:hypothetical protein
LDEARNLPEHSVAGIPSGQSNLAFFESFQKKKFNIRKLNKIVLYLN